MSTIVLKTLDNDIIIFLLLSLDLINDNIEFPAECECIFSGIPIKSSLLEHPLYSFKFYDELHNEYITKINRIGNILDLNLQINDNTLIQIRVDLITSNGFWSMNDISGNCDFIS